MTIRQRLRSLLWRVPIEQEVHDELAHHVELRTRELIDRGIDPDEARVPRHERGSKTAASKPSSRGSAGSATTRGRGATGSTSCGRTCSSRCGSAAPSPASRSPRS